jgi:hypothetical protein
VTTWRKTSRSIATVAALATLSPVTIFGASDALAGQAAGARQHPRAHQTRAASRSGHIACRARQAPARSARNHRRAVIVSAECVRGWKTSAARHRRRQAGGASGSGGAGGSGSHGPGGGVPTQPGGSTPATPPSSTPSEASGSASPPVVPSSGGLGWEGFGGGALPGASWRPYSSSSPFNQGAEGAPVVANSAAMVSAALANGLPGNLVAGNADTAGDWSHPVFFAQPSDPLYTLHATEPWGRNELEGMRIPVPANARPAGGGDGHMTVVTPDGWEYDFWQAKTPPPGGGTLDFSWGGRTRIDGNGTGSGGTAAGFGNLAGIIRAPELAAGKINHALFIVLKCAAQGTSFGYGTIASAGGSDSSYVYPATHGGSSCGGSEKNMPPLGARFRLAMSSAEIQALSVPAWKKTILTALAQYGGYVGDTGGPGFAFMFESSTSYTALGLPDPLVAFASKVGLPKWEGDYVFNMASGVEWSKYLQVLAPPSAS